MFVCWFGRLHRDAINIISTDFNYIKCLYGIGKKKQHKPILYFSFIKRQNEMHFNMSKSHNIFHRDNMGMFDMMAIFAGQNISIFFFTIFCVKKIDNIYQVFVIIIMEFANLLFSVGCDFSVGKIFFLPNYSENLNFFYFS